MMPDPFLAAPAAVQLHLVAGIAALALGPVAMLRRRRDRVHRAVGRMWVAAMGALALTGLSLGQGWSALDLLSVLTIGALALGVRHARRRNFEAHARAMRSLFLAGLVPAAIFTLLPGRLVHEVLFGETGAIPAQAVVVAGAAYAVLVLVWVARRLPPPGRPAPGRLSSR